MEEKMIAIKKIIAVGGVLLGTAGIVHAYLRTAPAYGTTAEGIFTFNEDDEMIAFTTDDREATTMDGKSEKVRWSAICGVYKEINGIRQPTELKAVWHYDEGDFTYFDAKAAMMSYDK
jgi:hypothetical protein